MDAFRTNPCVEWGVAKRTLQQRLFIRHFIYIRTEKLDNSTHTVGVLLSDALWIGSTKCCTAAGGFGPPTHPLAVPNTCAETRVKAKFPISTCKNRVIVVLIKNRVIVVLINTYYTLFPFPV